MESAVRQKAKDALDAQIEAYWDERAQSYSNGVRGELGDGRSDAWERVLMRSAKPVLDETITQLEKTPQVADLGCGPGFMSVLFSRMGCYVHAVDESLGMLSQAKANVGDAGLRQSVAFYRADVTELPFDDNTLDVVASRNVTWLLRRPKEAYAEWMRVLRPGGKLIVFDANWYLYLVNPLIDAQRVADQFGKVVEEWDEDSRATASEEERCERIATRLPLTSVVRPAWDERALLELGACDVRVDEDVWKELWTPGEKAFYASSPLFLVEARKSTS